MSNKDKVVIRREFFEGITIFEAGEVANEAFLIEQGEVQVFLEEDGQKQLIATLGAGETLGEMSLIKGGVRSASAVASKKTRVAIISKATMDEKLDECDPLVKTMLHRFTDRLNKSNEDMLQK